MTVRQPVIVRNGAIDTEAMATNAKEHVARAKDGTPVHACGLQSSRDCPCWTCTREQCAACTASMY